MSVAASTMSEKQPLNAQNRLARSEAKRTLSAMAPYASHSVDYHSKGHLLIVGSARRVLEAAKALPDIAKLTVLVTDNEAPKGPVGEWRTFAGALSRIEGYLGHFSAAICGDAQEIDLARTEGIGFYDIVLDLGQPAAMASELPPAGYFRPHDQASYQDALEQVRNLQGEFEKPRYVKLEPDRCAHSASGLVGCTRCLSVCPADAIRSEDEQIKVDVHLCHGIGACTTVCPSAALSYDYPNRLTLIDRARKLLRAYREKGGISALLLIHDSSDGEQRVNPAEESLPGHVLTFQVEELASAGMDLWLSALAYGAAEVALLDSTHHSEGALQVIDSELAIAQTLLEGMGYPTDRIRRITWDEARQSTPETQSAYSQEVASYAAFDDKREAIEMAVEHLALHGSSAQRAIELKTGAPFGAVSVSSACTLCMACVSVCPVNALQGGEDSPRLGFVERNCVQCGLCVQACPENAAVLQPRFLLDRGERHASQLLREDEPAHCLDCGKAFAPQSSIRRLQQRLSGHPMFAGSGARRLELCDDCRVKDILRSSGQGEAG